MSIRVHGYLWILCLSFAPGSMAMNLDNEDFNDGTA